jgi:hypothetical protein
MSDAESTDEPWETSERLGRVEPSATLAIGNAAAALEADGVDVVDLSVGEPDFPTPANVVEAGKDALDAGHTGYTSSNGVPELKRAIAEKLRGDGIDASPEEVIVTPGGKQALYETVQTLVDPGDEVVLLDPAWVSYEAMVKLAGGELTRVDTAPSFQLEPALDDLREAVTDDTELVFVNTPSNPTRTRRGGRRRRDLRPDHLRRRRADESGESRRARRADGDDQRLLEGLLDDGVAAGVSPRRRGVRRRGREAPLTLRLVCDELRPTRRDRGAPRDGRHRPGDG